MERITAKEVTSMMQAVAQVYEQQDAEQLDEKAVNRGAFRERTREAQERARIEADRRIQAAGGGAAAEEKELERLKSLNVRPKGSAGTRWRPRSEEELIRQARYTIRQRGQEALKNNPDYQPPEKRSASTPAKTDPTPEKTEVPSQLGSPDKEGARKRYGDTTYVVKNGSWVALGAGTNPPAGTTPPAETKPAGTTPPPETRPAPKPATPQEKAYGSRSALNKDQQAVNREYDRLRNSKDPKERAQAAAYGKKMAAAGAANKDFKKPTTPAPSTTGATTTRTVKSAASGGIGGYQTPASARPKSVNAAGIAAGLRSGATSTVKTGTTSAARPAATGTATPAARPVSGIQQRLQAIRDMRAASQERIRQQGGTPATPAVKSTTTTNTRQTVKSGDPMERMTGKGAASLMETYSKVYEEREPQAIDEGIMGALAKVGEVVAEEKTAADPGMKARMGKEAPKKGGYKLPERTPANAKNVEYYKDDVDLFDIIKGHFIEEGLTEEEALAKMLDLTDEERTEIIEGSCGSKKKSKKKGGY